MLDTNRPGCYGPHAERDASSLEIIIAINGEEDTAVSILTNRKRSMGSIQPLFWRVYQSERIVATSAIWGPCLGR